MRSIEDLQKEFELECARTHPERVVRHDMLLVHGFGCGASMMRDELIRWHAPSDVDSLERDKEYLLRFRSSVQAGSDIYALGYLSTSGVWFVRTDMVYGTYSFVTEYLRDLNKVSGVEDADFVGWRPIL